LMSPSKDAAVDEWIDDRYNDLGSDEESDYVVLLCKGADEVVLPRVTDTSSSTAALTSEHLEVFAGQGLRTLCLAYRKVPVSEYRRWLSQWQAANSLVGPGRESAVAHVCNFSKLYEPVESVRLFSFVVFTCVVAQSKRT
jgi:hypothetical protein